MWGLVRNLVLVTDRLKYVKDSTDICELVGGDVGGPLRGFCRPTNPFGERILALPLRAETHAGSLTKHLLVKRRKSLTKC